jgi:hypothetical protein
MGYMSDVKAVTKTADASAVVGRTRLKGVYFTNTATASSFTLRDGTTGTDTAIITINTPAAAGAQDLLMPEDGMVFADGIYVDVNDANVTSVTLLFEGGAAA